MQSCKVGEQTLLSGRGRLFAVALESRREVPRPKGAAQEHQPPQEQAGHASQSAGKAPQRDPGSAATEHASSPSQPLAETAPMAPPQAPPAHWQRPARMSQEEFDLRTAAAFQYAVDLAQRRRAERLAADAAASARLAAEQLQRAAATAVLTNAELKARPTAPLAAPSKPKGSVGQLNALTALRSTDEMPPPPPPLDARKRKAGDA